MILRALILAMLATLSGGQYIPAGAHFPTASTYNPCLISGWPMNEGSGLVLNDVSGNANTANLNNTNNVTWQSNAGFPGTTLLWGGNAATFTTTTSTSVLNFTGTTPFSVSAWIKITTGQQVFISSIQPAAYVGWEVGTGSVGTNQLDFLLISNNSTSKLEVHGSTNIQDNVKHFVVVTYDGSQSSSGVKLYVDASSNTVNVDANTLTTSAANPSAPWIARRNLDNLPVNGVFAYMAVYNCVLTPTQITTYNTAGPGIY